ncbi:NAP1-related protein 2-like isoform X2 [Olea europaea var. sylvestris]|uniref:NAP1-related protein 2-like isoform X2 n=1 Tax=Olea europaea var. sylvestris TaxID=158386 RepID=UPI000C1D6FCE|nr:NAP1-related protein 2-like isoform X2 [Olea europaea var. sylvestris]
MFSINYYINEGFREGLTNQNQQKILKMGLDKGKKQKLVEANEEKNGTELIDGELVLSVEKLQEVQDELEKINEEASEKVLEVEQKYNEIRKPVYDKRSDVIKSIPDFWLTAFLSHPAFSELLTEEDQKIFRYLSSLEVEDSKDVKSGYTITFNFNPNPYFEDTKLTKIFTFLEEGTTKITATSIKWKAGMGISNTVAEEKKGNKRSHSEESSILSEPSALAAKGNESFFTWFSDSQQKDDVNEIHDEQVAELIKDDIWPNPLTYFFDEADEEDSDMDDGDEKLSLPELGAALFVYEWLSYILP